MFTDMFTQSSETCLHYVYTMFEYMFTPCLKIFSLTMLEDMCTFVYTMLEMILAICLETSLTHI